jgi:hypothetical protein
MGERFGQHGSVLGWQFVNEYNRVCHCDRCRDRFRTFLCQMPDTSGQHSVIAWRFGDVITYPLKQLGAPNSFPTLICKQRAWGHISASTRRLGDPLNVT